MIRLICTQKKVLLPTLAKTETITLRTALSEIIKQIREKTNSATLLEKIIHPAINIGASGTKLIWALDSTIEGA
jgi:hypothetical protein